MRMIFELHAVAVDDEYNFSRYFSIFSIFYQKHSAPADWFYCPHHILSSTSHDIIACENNSSYSQILQNNQHYHFLSFFILSYFHPFQSVLDQLLVQQQNTLKDCCCRFVCQFSFVLNNFNVHFVNFSMETDTADGGGWKK